MTMVGMDARQSRSDEDVHRFYGRYNDTVTAMAAMACALDDASLVRSLQSANDSAPFSRVAMGNFPNMFSGHLSHCGPAGFAVHFESCRALESLSKDNLMGDLALTHKIDDPISGIVLESGDKVRLGTLISLIAPAPSPELIRCLAPRFLDQGGHPKQWVDEGHDWLTKELIPKACGGEWAHLYGALIDDLPQVLALDAPQAIECAVRHALPQVIHHFSGEIAFESITHARDPQGLLYWFPEDHPVEALLSFIFDGDLDRCDTDAALKEVLKAMVEQGRSDELFCVRIDLGAGRAEMPLAHVLSWYGLPASLSHLVESGWDLNARDGQGHTAEEFCREGFKLGSAAVLSTDENCAHVLRSSRARQTAMQSLVGLQEHEHRRRM